MIDNTRGILAMSAAVLVFIFNDALIKLAAETVPSVQAIGVRGLFATLWVVLALAVIVGFVGVLMVIQPHPGDINGWTWLVLLGTMIGALRDILGRYLPRDVPTLVVTFASAATVALAGCAWIVVEGWQPMTAYEIGLLIASSLLLTVGYQFLVIALRSGAEFSVIGSFRYASVLWALVIGYFVWGDVPNALALLGIVVIVGSGLYILHRERVRR